MLMGMKGDALFLTSMEVMIEWQTDSMEYKRTDGEQ